MYQLPICDAERKAINASIEVFINKYVKHSNLFDYCDFWLYSKYFNEVASTRYHHDLPDGIRVHVHEMLVMSQGILDSDFEFNRQIVVAGIILHDIGKGFIYDVDGKSRNETGKLIEHISLGFSLFNSWAIDKKINIELTKQIGHIILSHHGRKEWGSPVEPQTPEAHIVHHLDMLSSRISPYKKTKGK